MIDMETTRFTLTLNHPEDGTSHSEYAKGNVIAFLKDLIQDIEDGMYDNGQFSNLRISYMANVNPPHEMVLAQQ